MKITAVEPIHLRVPVVDAIPDGTLDVLVVRIHTDAGLTGIGEVTSQSYVCKACFEAPRSAARRHGLDVDLARRGPARRRDGCGRRCTTRRIATAAAAPRFTPSAAPTSPCGT